ncbi:hypothetical protein [Nocardia pseudobrasiliensis]|uniref:Arc-like DNA binding dprotein n=1 Tax=Nocardia pseudobrasiliensis TaxID=45979 RepID=A0A370HZQ9_9NOCA|nr:hypothetical protein [Nocardia pseudobrasiliensis]RDI63810.1 hypothetical protein DFR76_109150 [Nocardia pseudobrasiliensis]
MVALQIRDVPEELRDKLVVLARERGQSLQAYLFDLIRDEARRKDNLAVLKRFGPGGVLNPDDVTAALDAERADRDAALDDPAATR